MYRRVTSPTWGPIPPCKQALNDIKLLEIQTIMANSAPSSVSPLCFSRGCSEDLGVGREGGVGGRVSVTR